MPTKKYTRRRKPEPPKRKHPFVITEQMLDDVFQPRPGETFTEFNQRLRAAWEIPEYRDAIQARWHEEGYEMDLHCDARGNVLRMWLRPLAAA